MGKQHRILKKARLIHEFQWNAKRLQYDFGENLENIRLQNDSAFGRNINRKRPSKPPAVSVAHLLGNLQEIGFYSLCTFNRLLEDQVREREREQKRLIQQLIYKAGRLSLSRDQLMEMAASFFSRPTSKESYFESGYVDMGRFLDHEFVFLEFLFNSQLRFLLDALAVRETRVLKVPRVQ